MLLKLKLPGAPLTVPLEYGRIYDSLSVMTRSYKETAERGRKVSLGVQWVFFAASAARPSEYYSASAKRIESLLDEINAGVGSSRSDSSGSDSSSRFATLFELRYHPKFGSYPNSDLRARLFEEFWPEVKHGSIDAFDLCDRLRSLDRLTPEERAEALKDAIWAWQNQSKPK